MKTCDQLQTMAHKILSDNKHFVSISSNKHRDHAPDATSIAGSAYSTIQTNLQRNTLIVALPEIAWFKEKLQHVYSINSNASDATTRVESFG